MAESKVFLTVLDLLKMELAGLASGILLLLYLTKKTQERAKTRAATTRQMMARPQPGIGWSGVTAVVITELVTELLSVLVELDTVELDEGIVVVTVVTVDVDDVVVLVDTWVDEAMVLVDTELDQVVVLVDNKVSGVVVVVDVEGVVEFSWLVSFLILISL